MYVRTYWHPSVCLTFTVQYNVRTWVRICRSLKQAQFGDDDWRPREVSRGHLMVARTVTMHFGKYLRTCGLTRIQHHCCATCSLSAATAGSSACQHYLATRGPPCACNQICRFPQPTHVRTYVRTCDDAHWYVPTYSYFGHVHTDLFIDSHFRTMQVQT